METKFKRVQEEIEVLKWHLKDNALTETGKERLKELETLMDYAHSSLLLKNKEIPTFEEWVKLDKERIEIYKTYLRGFAYKNLAHLYRKYTQEFNITLIV